MSGIESPNLRQLHETTFEWLVQHGDPTPANGVEPTFAPDGLPIVEDEASFSAQLTGPEVWSLDDDAAQTLGVDNVHGALRLGAFEAAYNRNGWGNLVYSSARTQFVVLYPGRHYLRETTLHLLDEKGGLEVDVMDVFRSGADRDLFMMTTNDTLDKIIGISGDSEVGEQQVTALSSVVAALKRQWPEIKAAREASKG